MESRKCFNPNYNESLPKTFEIKKRFRVNLRASSVYVRKNGFNQLFKILFHKAIKYINIKREKEKETINIKVYINKMQHTYTIEKNQHV
jgi:hypothetical protein